MSFRKHYYLFLLIFAGIRAEAQSLFNVEKISPNVYAFIPPGPLEDVVEGNSVAVIGDKGIFIIDTFGDSFTAEAMIEEVRKLSSLPVTYILNTHWHYDHVMGNWIWKQHYPSAIIISQRETKRLLDIKIPAVIKGEPKASIDYIAGLKKQIADGKSEDGKLLSNYERNVRFPKTISDLEIGMKHLAKYKYQPPDVTFTDSLTLYLGKDSVLIFHPGRAHSPGDAMAYIPSQKILVTGDEIISPVPYAFGPYHTGWHIVLEEIIRLNPSIIVPGHGAVQRNLDYVRDQLSLLKALYQAATDALRKGLTLDQAQQAITLEPFREKFAAKDPMRNWAFRNYFINPGLKSLYKQVQENFIPRN